MKFRIRKPSFKKSIAARSSWKRVVRHSMGFKAPRGWGWITNPKKAAYNRAYNQNTFKADNLIVLGILLIFGAFKIIFWILKFSVEIIAEIFFKKTDPITDNSASTDRPKNELPFCPRCNSAMILRTGKWGQFYGCSHFPRCKGTRDFSR